MNNKVRIALISIAALVAIGLAYVFLVLPGRLEASMNKIAAHEPYEITTEAQTLHETLIVGDLHSDTLLWNRDILQKSERGHVDVPRLREGNVALQVFPAVTKVPAGINYDANTGDSDNIKWLAMVQLWPISTWTSLNARALYQSKKLHRAANRAPEALKVIRNKSDLQDLFAARLGGTKTVGALLSFEGAHALEGDLANIDTLYDAGYRLMELHHFFDNELGGSLHGTSGGGLTDFGRDAVQAMEAKGIIIDVAHSSEAVVDEVLAMTSRPVVVSHTGLKGTCDSARNISDDHMKRIAAAGGLIGIGYWDGAVCEIMPAGVVAAIRYGIDLVGVEHIALGSDYDGSTEVSFDTSELVVLTQTMLNYGFSEREIRAVMGGNLAWFLANNLPEE